jgi:beta-phosphoglucomutase
MATAENYGVVFDVDGVLVDSHEAHYLSWKQLFDEHQKPFTRQMFVDGFGMTTREVLRKQFIAPGEELTDAQIHEIDLYKEGIYRQMMQQNFTGMPGAKALIEKLHHAGMQVAVGSSGPKENVEVAIQGLQVGDLIPPASRINGGDVKRGKPDPEIFLKAIASIGLKPAQCVIIEDAPVGLQAARSAGAKCVGFASVGRTREELSAADLVIDDLSELSPQVLQRVIDG